MHKTWKTQTFTVTESSELVNSNKFILYKYDIHMKYI